MASLLLILVSLFFTGIRISTGEAGEGVLVLLLASQDTVVAVALDSAEKLVTEQAAWAGP